MSCCCACVSARVRWRTGKPQSSPARGRTHSPRTHPLTHTPQEDDEDLDEEQRAVAKRERERLRMQAKQKKEALERMKREAEAGGASTSQVDVGYVGRLLVRACMRAERRCLPRGELF